MSDVAPDGGRRAVTVVLLLAGIGMAWTDVLEDRAAEYLERALVRAGTAYVSARGLNAAISVIQESELELSPAGLGVSLAAGQVLDPVNDLVEQFSSVMLVASTSLIVQRVMIEVARWSLVRWALTLAGAGMILLLLSGRLPARGLRRSGFRLVTWMMLFRFLVPVTVLAGSELSRRFVEARIDDHEKVLDRSHQEAQEASDQLAKKDPPDEGFLARARGVMEVIDIRAHVRRVQEGGTRAIEAMLHLLALFLLETILFPIGLLWLITRLGRAAGGE